MLGARARESNNVTMGGPPFFSRTTGIDLLSKYLYAHIGTGEMESEQGSPTV